MARMPEMSPTTARWLAEGPRMVVDGQRPPAASGRTFATMDPSTGAVLAEVPRGEADDVDRAVEAARSAFDDRRWSGMRPGKRTEILYAVAQLLRANLDELAELESADTGKPLRQASGEVWLAADCFRYYAGWPTKAVGETIPSGEDLLVYTTREPVGVCAGITAWNFPLLLATFKVAPALAFGNPIILKPAELAPLSSLRLGELCLEAGVPPGLVSVITGLGSEAGAALASHPHVDKVAFTGSTAVGRQVVHASEGNLKRVSLELGGKSPNIVLPDADFERAAAGALQGVFLNSGQMCTAGTRVLVHADIYDEFVHTLAQQASALRIGPGRDPETELGPLISSRQLARVTGYVDAGVRGGARLVTGGGQPSDLAGHFLEPTVFADVDNSMVIAREEIFGPVASVIPIANIDEAAAVANDSAYGLAAAVWTSDLGTAHRLARRLRAGTVWINTYGLLDPAVPFGGFKDSGYGRELGRDSMELYTESKAVLVRIAAS